MGAVKYRGHDLPAQSLGGHTQVNLQYLSDVHTGRYAQRIEHDVQRSAIRQERHILLRQDAGNNTLVSVTSGHLIAHRDLTALCDIYPHHLIDLSGQLIGVFTGEYLDIHDDAIFAVRYLQGGIPHLSGLLSEDGAKQPFLGNQFGLALGRNLAHQDIAGAHLGADADDAVLIQIGQSVLRNVGNIPGNLLRSQLGVSGFDLVLFNMNGGIGVLTNDLFVDEHRILVVVTFPGHKADEHILAQADLTVAGGGTVGDDLTFGDLIALIHNGTLVDAGALVGTGELHQVVNFQCSFLGADGDLIGAHPLHNTVLLGQHHDAGIHSGFIFHAGAYNRRFGLEQRHRLTLHVGAHQGTVGVIVFQKGDHGGSYRHNHLGRNVHIVGSLPLHLQNGVAVTHIDSGTGKPAVLIDGLVGLGDNIFIFHIGGHIDHLVGDLSGFLVHLAVGGLNEAILVDAGKGGQIGDQADVGTLRGLDGTHTAVVAVVYVTHLKSGAVTGQTARSQCGETTLMGQFRQRVGLVHKLGQRGGSEELLHRRRHRTDVDQRLGGKALSILRLKHHTVADDLLHTGEADPVLVLQQLAHRTDPAVAQMVDVIGGADVVVEVDQIVDGGEDIVNGDMLGDQFSSTVTDGFLHSIQIGAGLQNLLEHREAHLLVDAQLLTVKGHEILDIHHAVGDDLTFQIIHLDKNGIHTGAFDGFGILPAQTGSRVEEQLPGEGIDDRTGEHLTHQAVGDGKFFVVFIASYPGKIITLGIEEQSVQMGLSAFHRGGLAGAQLTADFHQSILGIAVFRLFLLDGGEDLHVLGKESLDLLVGTQSQRTDKGGDGDLSVFIDSYINHVVDVGLIFQPGAPIGDYGGGIQLLTGFLVVGHSIINTRRTNQLRHNSTLCTVDDKGAGIGHQRKIAHINVFLHFDLAGFLVEQSGTDLERRSIGDFASLALLHTILRLIIQLIIYKV